MSPIGPMGLMGLMGPMGLMGLMGLYGAVRPLPALDVFLRVVRQVGAQIALRAWRVLAAVLFAPRALVAEDFAAADHVDLLDLFFSSSLVVAHARGLSKEETGPRPRADEREIIFAASDDCGACGRRP